MSIFCVGSDGRLRYASPFACRRLGYTRGELLRMHVWDLDPRQRPETWSRHWRAAKKEGGHTFESVHRTRDGKEFPVEVTVRFVKQGAQEFRCAFARDIGEQKKMESRSALRLAIEATLATVSTRFISLPIGRIDGEIPRALKSIGQLIAAKRICLAFTNKSGTSLLCAHRWVGDKTVSRCSVSGVMEVLRSGRSSIRSRGVSFVPAASWRRRDGCCASSSCGARAKARTLAAPLIIDGHLRGALIAVMSTDHLQSRQDVIRVMRSAGQVFSNVLARREMKQELMAAQAGLERLVAARTRHLRSMTQHLRAEVVRRRDAQLSLKRQKHLLERTLATLPVGVWLTDATGRIVSANRAALRIWGGIRRVSLKGYAKYKAWWSATGRRVRPDEWGLARAIRKSETSLEEMVDILGFDGRHKTILNSCAPVLDEHRRVVAAVAVNQDITEKRRLEEELLSICEREQRRFGQDLHDGLCQHLTAVRYACEAAVAKLRSGPRSGWKALDRVRSLVEETQSQARDLARGTWPLKLGQASLREAIQHLGRSLQRACGISVVLRFDRGVAVPGQTVAMHLYRFVQEAVQNSIRHGRATRIQISMTRPRNSGLTLRVADNGCGMRRGRAAEHGMGMRTMAYRAHLLGGKFILKSRIGRGTSVSISMGRTGDFRRRM